MNSSRQCQNVQRNLIVCLHFKTQGTIWFGSLMVYIAVYIRSHGHKKFRESRHTDKQTISFFN